MGEAHGGGPLAPKGAPTKGARPKGPVGRKPPKKGPARSPRQDQAHSPQDKEAVTPAAELGPAA